MSLSNAELAKRADMAIADLATAGKMNPEQANSFINLVEEKSTLLKQVRVERMTGPEKKINRIGFGSRIMHAAPQGATPYADDAGANDRWLAAASRVKPTTSQIVLTTKEYMVECHVPYEVFEDNVEGASLETRLMNQITERSALDMEEFALFSDTGSGDADLALQNGWLKLMTSNVVDNSNAGVTPTMFKNGLLTLPQKYLGYLDQMKHFVSMANTIKYRDLVSQRATGYGDSMLTGNGPIFAHGVLVEGTPRLAADTVGAKGILTFPKNLIFGIQRDISVETEKEIRAREIIIVLTVRIALQVDDQLAAVKYVNI